MRTVPLLGLIACQDPTGSPPDPPHGTAPGPVWRDRAVDGTVLARAFDHTGEDAGAVSCRSADDPDEVHVAVPDGRTGSADGEIVLYGLLAETDYECALTVGDATEVRSFRTGSLPDWLPTWTMPVRGDAGGAYTLFNHGTDRRGDRQAKLLIVDPEGRLRWYYDVPYDAADLDASWLGDGQILYGGGYSAPPTVIDLAGRVVMDAAPIPQPHDYHHDTERLESGEFLAVSETANTDGVFTWDGARLDVFDPGLVAPVWTWDTQRAVDEGWLPPDDRNGGDPYHTNSMQMVGDQLYVNFRPLSFIARIDRPTGDLVWRLGQGGDFLLVDETGAPDDPANWFYGPHAPEHDGNTVLAYDNGGGRPGGVRQSRAVEITYDEASMTAQVTWEYTEEGWFEVIWGDVDRLPGGNVLVTRAHCTKCQPTVDTRTELFEVDPTTNTVVWRLRMDDPEDAGYRAERIDGCAIFANARYCP